MQGARHKFHEELDWLQSEMVTLADLAERAVSDAFESILHRDAELADKVIAGDDEVDAHYLEVERRVFNLLARQTPVASDLRLVTAVLHINLHLERVADMGVNIAKIAKVTMEWPSNETVLLHLQEMADVAGTMLRTAIEAFVRRDLKLCRVLPKMDDPVDRLNRGMYREVAALASDPRMLEWGIHMNVVSRQLERVADHAVDIGEQVAFLLTGVFQEFSDASHPVAEA
ncbi:MAG TPA: phosphate signaling complex protein PhoU [Actinomycetota bacterium]|nr:phosphate signaling complex protein PhoU [Actinomycetota bacterium]